MRHFFPRTDDRIYPRRWGTPPDIDEGIFNEQFLYGGMSKEEWLKTHEEEAPQARIPRTFKPQPKITHIHPM